MKSHIYLLVLFIASSLQGISQKVTVSEDINLRSDFLYTILGKVDEKILLYRDKGFDQTLQVFDENLWEKESVDLEFEKKRIDPVGIVAGKKDFRFIYTYRKKGDQVLACRKFDASGSMIDTATIWVNSALLDYQKFYLAHSENRRFVSIFSFRRENTMNVYMFDTEEMTLKWKNIYAFDFQYVRRDFRELVVSDRGEGILLFEKDIFKLGKSDASLEAYYLSASNGSLSKQIFSFGDKYLVDYYLDYDNVNDKLVLAGLYGNRFRSRANGYFMKSGDELVFNPFDINLYQELEKNSKRKMTSLEDYVVADIIIRQDGGVLLVSEMQREFSRKTNMLEGRRQSFDLRAYVDYYNEDIVVFSIHPNGKEHWRQILRKKQFSQDDGAYYSSFFVFKSPAELRFIYNDEIKMDNTVSEYILNPIGENERNIVMNTEYQKLKLRFQEAIQISTKDFLVPSERNNKFNLVKVSY